MTSNDTLKDPQADRLINVLDHGYVRLVDFMGGDLSIVRAARNSYDAAWRTGLNEQNDEKLIHYLWKHQHTTPFESVTMTFDIKLPIFVVRQWHRHRTWTYNEVSARYSVLPDEFYFPTAGMVGAQHASNKQMRVTDHAQQIDDLLSRGLGTGMTATEQELWVAGKNREKDLLAVREHCEDAYMLYRSLIEQGWPRELARMVLPLNIYTRMFATVDLHNLLHFIKLRDHDHAQHEIRVYAQAMKALVSTFITPVAIQAFDSDNSVSETVSR